MRGGVVRAKLKIGAIGIHGARTVARLLHLHGVLDDSHRVIGGLCRRGRGVNVSQQKEGRSQTAAGDE
jgi:hypothetical protein